MSHPPPPSAFPADRARALLRAARAFLRRGRALDEDARRHRRGSATAARLADSFAACLLAVRELERRLDRLDRDPGAPGGAAAFWNLVGAGSAGRATPPAADPTPAQ